MPEYEFYGPKFGHEWGYIENEALFPEETKIDKTVYIKNSLPPPSAYTGYKYIPICYFYPKNMDAKTREGNSIFVAHYVLVPSSFNDTVRNFMLLPVFNPIANMTIEVSIERTFKQFTKVGPIIEELIDKNPNTKSTPQLDDPMTHPNKLIKNQTSSKDNKTESSAEQQQQFKEKQEEAIKQAKLKQAEEEHKRLALIAKREEEEQNKKRIKKEQDFLANIDFGLIFPPHKNEQPLIIVNSVAEERSLGHGGFSLLPSEKQEQKHERYFVKDSMILTNMRKSIYYPPFDLEAPSVPFDAETNIMNIGLGLIAIYKPPRSLIAACKYTFFFLAPATFRYPEDKRVYVPVYILVPLNETKRPSDMNALKVCQIPAIPEPSKSMYDKDSGIFFKIEKMQPGKIPIESYPLVKNKFHLDSPMTPMTEEFFTEKENFADFLLKNSLVNRADEYAQKLKDQEKLVYMDQNNLRLYMDNLLYFKSDDRKKMIDEAIAMSVRVARRKRDEEREKQLRENIKVKDARVKKQMKEEELLKQKADILNEQLKALREMLKQVNPGSSLLKSNSSSSAAAQQTKQPSSLLI